MSPKSKVQSPKSKIRAQGLRVEGWRSVWAYAPRTTHHASRAFTLIEILVTVGLLTFIVLGLMAMFQQTQRAFRTGLTQTDVLEAGRSLADMMQRDLEQVTPSQAPRTTNFIAEVALPARLDGSFQPWVSYQDLPGDQTPPQQRINLFYDFFFLTRQNQTWIGIGYVVDTPTSGVGTLYRWQETTNMFNNGNILSRLSFDFDNAARRLYLGDYSDTTNTLKRVADGVVDLRVKCYGPDGTMLVPQFYPGTNYPQYTFIYTNLVLPAEIRPTEEDSFFASNAVPAYVEVEIGFLEDRTLARFRSIPDPAARGQYLTNHSAQVHLFRQRIPIRNVDLNAYSASQ